MFWRYVYFSIAFTFLCDFQAYAFQRHQLNLTLLKAPVAMWNDNRLNAQLKNVPVKTLLEELMSRVGGACDVSGSLPGAISITIDNLTTAAAIHKIMRHQKYDYTMILTGFESPDSGSDTISELTIYRGDDVIRFIKVPNDSRPVQQAGPETIFTPVAETPAQQPTLPVAGMELMKLDREIESFIDEMLAEKKLSKQAYDEALRILRDGENVACT